MSRWYRITEEHIYRHQHMLPWAIRRESFPPCHCSECEKERERERQEACPGCGQPMSYHDVEGFCL